VQNDAGGGRGDARFYVARIFSVEIGIGVGVVVRISYREDDHVFGCIEVPARA
jgi:hypothetical protein